MKRKSDCLMLLLAVLCALLMGATGCGGGSVQAPYYAETSVVPATGPSSPGVEAFDQRISAVLKKWDIPGATVAVTRNGQLILARGYGYADVDAKQAMPADATLRIGSCSKVFTAVAIMRLHDEGKLDLDSRFLDILTDYTLPPNADQRLRDITLRMLLHHAGGWDRDVSGDPFNDQIKIAEALGVPPPAGCSELIRYMVGKPLDFAPGTKTAYSNVGYCILGRVVEKVAGEPYEVYVRDKILAPIGIHGMYVGTSRQGQQGPYEPKYYDYSGASLTRSVFPGDGKVPLQYGGLEMMDAPGGWIASAEDLLRFITSLEGSRGPALLSSESLQEMLANPHLPGKLSDPYWYGFGIQGEQIGSQPVLWSHGGSFPGAQSIFVHYLDGYSYTMLTNSRGRDANGLSADMSSALLSAVQAIQGTTSGPDLFPEFPSPTLPPKGR